MKKKIISLALTLVLALSMVIPAAASTISDGRTWNGVIYHTNDTCNPTTYYCVIECDCVEYTIRTDVEGYAYTGAARSTEPYCYYAGNDGTFISTHSGRFQREMSSMYAYHYINGNMASYQKVWAG